MRAKLREVAEASVRDPKRALLNELGDTSTMTVFHNQVMVATYITPPRIMKGPNGEDIVFHHTDRKHAEDRFQAKIFLVVKCGPLAFKDDSIAKFGGLDVSEGDWVMARPSDGLEFFWGDGKNGVACRLFEDVHIKARVSDPELVY